MRVVAALVCLAVGLLAQTRQLAITIDDLPRGGDKAGPQFLADTMEMTRKLTVALRGVPVTVFINPGRARQLGDEGLQSALKLWKLQGAELGNHTFNHPDLNRTPLEEYEADILRAEPAIRQARGGTPSRYFRHPFLHTGPTAAVQSGLTQFLAEHKLIPAPVTIDTADWRFARVYTGTKDAVHLKREYLLYMESVTAYFETRAREVTGGDIPQVLLIHANQLNADTMTDLLVMFRKRGYRFVTLDEALTHPAYQLKDGYTGTNGFSWLHRWAIARGIKPSSEPNEPDWLIEEYNRQR